VLYQCVVGTPPFVAKSILALSNLMARSEYTRVSQIRADAPRELDSIVWRSLRADPNDRYPSARELREDLLRLARRSLPQRTLSIGAASPVPPAVKTSALGTAAASRAVSPRPPAVSRAVPAPYPLTPATVPRTPARVESLVETVIPRTRRQGERERS
jgi:serine/threonine protein kinase